MPDDPFEIRVTLAPLPETDDTMVLPWPAELDVDQRHFVLSELVTQLQQYAIWVQPDNVTDPTQCYLRSDAETWQTQGTMIASVLSNLVHQAVVSDGNERSVIVGYADAS